MRLSPSLCASDQLLTASGRLTDHHSADGVLPLKGFPKVQEMPEGDIQRVSVDRNEIPALVSDVKYVCPVKDRHWLSSTVRRNDQVSIRVSRHLNSDAGPNTLGRLP